jgi:hypothetical protein
MKKIMVLVTSIVMTLSIGSTAFAAGDTTSLADQAGITPDSILYPVDKAVDSLKVTFSFSDTAKADTLSQIAQERLGESEVMAGENKQDLATTALNDYQNTMDAAQTKIEDAINTAETAADTTATDTTDTKTTDAQDKLTKLEDEESKIADKEKTSLEVLAKLQDKVGDNAKDVIAKVIEMQTAKRDAMLAVKQERKIYNEAKKAYHQAKAALEKAKKSGDETAVKAAEDLLQQKQDALNTEKQKLATAMQAKKDADKINVGKLKKDAKKDQNTTTDSTNTTDGTATTTTTTDGTAATSTTTNTSEAGSTTTVTTDAAKAKAAKPAVKPAPKNDNSSTSGNSAAAKTEHAPKSEKAQH